MEVHKVPQWKWKPLAVRGCQGAVARVLIRNAKVVPVLARFDPNASLAEHASEHPMEVVCLEGRGRTSVGFGARLETADLRAGQSARWPAGPLHRLWTEEDGMLALLGEYL